MDEAEDIASDYLKKFGFPVVYEPDGNCPPDFRLGHEIAVEVRRLNENYFGDERTRGLDTDRRRVRKAVRGVVDTIVRETASEAFYVSIDFSRPITDLRQIKKHVRRKLNEFLANPDECPCSIPITQTLRLQIDERPTPDIRPFRMAFQGDSDSGGHVLSIYVKNANHCINEKTQKISSFRERYPKWWLILVDTIKGFSRRDPDDAAEIEQGQRALWAGEAGWMAGALLWCVLQAREWCVSMRLASQ